MKEFVQGFKEFAMRNNVTDLAVGVIIGGTFGQIASSLVKGTVIPVLPAITEKISLGELALTTPDIFGGADIVTAYDASLQNVLDFVITTFVIFIVIRLMNRLRQKKDEKPAAEPEAPILSKREELLTKIRGLLEGNNET